MENQPDIEYLPTEWLDEYTPAWLKNPSHFIRMDGDQIQLHPRDHHNDWIGPENHNINFVEEMSIGDVCRFSRSRDHGTMSVTVHEDGTATHDDPPAEITFFSVVVADASGNTLDELLEDPDIEPGLIEVRMIEELPSQMFRLDMVEGKPAFVLIEAVH